MGMNNFFETQHIQGLIVIVVLVIIFLIILFWLGRELVCWYFKIDKFLGYLESIDKRLKVIEEAHHGDMGSSLKDNIQEPRDIY
jgi:hypothetical protein